MKTTMKTRIKYTKIGTSLQSEWLQTYIGERLTIYISPENSGHNLFILDKNGDVLEKEYCSSLQRAKKLGRKILINKYQVRLNEEIRIGK